jgi:GT2 family glycosyltransferase
LFDTYFVERGRAFPQLHPGFNEIFGLNCDYFRSRFIARAGALRLVAANQSLASPRLAAKALLATSLKRDGISGVHLPWAFMRIKDSVDALAHESRALIAGEIATEFGTGLRRRITNRKVSVIICTRDKGHLLRQLVRGILETASELIEQVVVIHHATQNPYALKTLDDLKCYRQLLLIPYEGPFNFSRQCNLGARAATTPFLLFLNDDVAPITSDWLEQLLLPFDNPAVGMTGPMLLYPDERVQHAGMYLGFNQTAGHTLRSARLPADDYLFMSQAPREVSSLTGAAVVIERDLFCDLNGFDPLLGTSLQDVELSLRVNRSGRRLVFNPKSILLHMESVSVRNTLVNPAVRMTREREHAYFKRRWDRQLEHDSFHNPAFDLAAEDLRSLRLPG